MAPAPRLALIAIALTLAACGKGGGGAPAVTDAWVRLPAAAGRPGAAYFTVTGGSEATRLVAVESPLAERIELHRMAMDRGRMTMQRLNGVDLAPGQRVAFAPAGNHGMAFGLTADAKAGGTTRLTFRFEKGAPVTAEAKLVAAGDDAPY